MGAIAERTADAERGTRSPPREGGTLTVVIDASVAVAAALAARWPATLVSDERVAPSLLWSEATASLRQLEWRGEIDSAMVQAALDWLARAAIDVPSSAELATGAWRIASSLGWAKTYDAEYVALAQRLRVPLMTLDARLGRSAQRIVEVRRPGPEA